ncbi:MAG: response regulator containing a CheY-like receiver domain and a GGDEF domain [Elusimicrobia bacterium]|nr:MAG: response regulator containing a CheY-like receiver domain and a GGDEF domain [Elusimicrobiota bacterium]KAF0154254.1 MAG: response regulator containing a CheY-like receiver domain and a GGDEF domain [Elusimicrobiota bacterium]
MRRKTILVVDDEAIWRNLLCRLLTPAGYRVITAPSGACGLQAARTGDADCVILDYHLRDGTAREFCPAMRAAAPRRVPVIIFSSEPSAADLLTCEGGADAFFLKTTPLRTLLSAIRDLTG